MTDVVNFVMLIAASIGSMALGILAAYWVLRAGFALMRPNGVLAVQTRLHAPNVESEA